MNKDTRKIGITLFQFLLAGFMFLIGTRIMDLSLVDITTTIERLFTGLMGMTLMRSQRYSAVEARKLKAQVLKTAKEWRIERKIRFILVNGNSRYTEQGKQMALPGSGVVICADFTGVNNLSTQVIHIETGKILYQSQKKGEIVESFRKGGWVNFLNSEYDWIVWQVENPQAAEIVDKFGEVDEGWTE
jgi:hypothetical protein